MKRKTWKQANPNDQMTVLLMAMEGHTSNARNNLISPVAFFKYMKALHDELKDLQYFLKHPDQW